MQKTKKKIQKTKKKEWVLAAVQEGNPCMIAVDAITGEKIAYVLSVGQDGVWRAWACKYVLEDLGYDTSCTKWDENGAIKNT